MPIYRLLSPASHCSITAFQFEISLTFMNTANNAVTSQFLCRMMWCGNTTQLQCSWQTFITPWVGDSCNCTSTISQNLCSWQLTWRIQGMLIRVGILARLRIIDPLFFLWTHRFQLQLTITRPLGRACIHNGVKISHGKSLTMSHFCPPNNQNIELHVLN